MNNIRIIFSRFIKIKGRLIFLFLFFILLNACQWNNRNKETLLFIQDKYFSILFDQSIGKDLKYTLNKYFNFEIITTNSVNINEVQGFIINKNIKWLVFSPYISRQFGDILNYTFPKLYIFEFLLPTYLSHHSSYQILFSRKQAFIDLAHLLETILEKKNTTQMLFIMDRQDPQQKEEWEIFNTELTQRQIENTNNIQYFFISSDFNLNELNLLDANWECIIVLANIHNQDIINYFYTIPILITENSNTILLRKKDTYYSIDLDWESSLDALIQAIKKGKQNTFETIEAKLNKIN